MVEKKDIDELEAIYKKVTYSLNVPEVTVQQQSQPIIPQAPIIQPTVQAPIISIPAQEIRTSDKDSFTPMDLPTRNLDKAIEDWAEKRKQHDIDLAYKKLTNMLFQPDAPQPTGLPQQPQQPQQPVIQQVLVKDNSEAIRLIDLEIMNPENKDLEGLIAVKRRLQGLPPDQRQPQRQEPIENNKKKVGSNSNGKVERNFSKKLAFGLGALLFTVTIGIWYGLMVSGMLH
jgi:hypothetical protein